MSFLIPDIESSTKEIIDFYKNMSKYVENNQLELIKKTIDSVKPIKVTKSLEEVLTIALTYNNLNVVEYVSEKFYDLILLDNFLKNEHPHNCTLLKQALQETYKHAFERASEEGQLDIVIYLKEANPLNIYCIDTFYNDKLAIRTASKKNHYHVVEYLVMTSNINKHDILTFKKFLDEEQYAYVEKIYDLKKLHQKLDTNLNVNLQTKNSKL